MTRYPQRSREVTQVRFAVVYHVPLTVVAGDGVYEPEGAFGRYVEALARVFKEVVLIAPARSAARPPSGYRINASNVRVAPLPWFDGPAGFVRRLPQVVLALARSVNEWDVLNIRVPTPASWTAFLIACLASRPTCLLVVGDLEAAMTMHVERNWRTRLLTLYARLDGWVNHRLAERSLTFVNGRELFDRYRSSAQRAVLVQTSTITTADVRTRDDRPLADRTVQLLTVCRVEPRKGVRHFPSILAVLNRRGIQAELTVVGPEVGSAGVEEHRITLERARALGVTAQLRIVGARSLPEIQRLYDTHDLFLLASGPGEGVPRVLLEAMAAGVPIVASPAGGIPTVIEHGHTGLLADPSDAESFAAAIQLLVEDAALRRRLRSGGSRLAREHTVDAQVAHMVREMVNESVVSGGSVWPGECDARGQAGV